MRILSEIVMNPDGQKRAGGAIIDVCVERCVERL